MATVGTIKRPRQVDYLKTISRISNWEEFSKLDSDLSQSQAGYNDLGDMSSDNQKQSSNPKKMEIPIIVSQVQKTNNTSHKIQNPNVDDINKKRKLMQSSYIRVREDKLWPTQDKYELVDDDVIFLKDFNQSQGINMKQEELEGLIEDFEVRSGRDFIISWFDMKERVRLNLRDKFNQPILEKIYNYWKNRRDLMKRPLLRIHWKPNYSEQDPHVAFRPRVPERMKLRWKKQSEWDQYEKLIGLREEMNKYKLLIEQTTAREELKTILLETQSMQFIGELIKIDKTLCHLLADDMIEGVKEYEQRNKIIEERGNIIQKKVLQLNTSHVNAIKGSLSYDGSCNNYNNNSNNFGFGNIKAHNGNNQPFKNTNLNVSNAQNPKLLQEVKNKKHIKHTGNSHKEMNPSLDEMQGYGTSFPMTQSSFNLQYEKESDVMSGEENKKLRKQQKKQNKQLQKNQKLYNHDNQDSSLNNITNNQSLSNQDSNKQLISQKQIQQKDASGTAAIKASGSEISLTNDFDFASFLVGIFLEGNLSELNLEKVTNFDMKQVDKNDIKNILLNNNGDLAASLRIKQKLLQNNNNSQNKPPFSNLQGNQAHQVQSQQPQQEQGINQQNINNNINSINHTNYPQMVNQRQLIPLNEFDNSEQSNSKQNTINNNNINSNHKAIINSNEMSPDNSKKKNIIAFKTRLRIGRSNLLNIDRLFDDSENMRYEDICNKEANYQPNKALDKLMKQRYCPRLNSVESIYTYSQSQLNDLYKRQYFQQRLLKCKQLSIDIEDQQSLPLIQNNSALSISNSQIAIQSSNLNLLSNQILNTSANALGYSNSQNGINIPEKQLQLLNAQIGNNLSQSIYCSAALEEFACQVNQPLQSDVENKQLKKLISQGLKDYQKKKAIISSSSSAK